MAPSEKIQIRDIEQQRGENTSLFVDLGKYPDGRNVPDDKKFTRIIEQLIKGEYIGIHIIVLNKELRKRGLGSIGAPRFLKMQKKLLLAIEKEITKKSEQHLGVPYPDFLPYLQSAEILTGGHLLIKYKKEKVSGSFQIDLLARSSKELSPKENWTEEDLQTLRDEIDYPHSHWMERTLIGGAISILVGEGKYHLGEKLAQKIHKIRIGNLSVDINEIIDFSKGDSELYRILEKKGFTLNPGSLEIQNTGKKVKLGKIIKALKNTPLAILKDRGIKTENIASKEIQKIQQEFIVALEEISTKYGNSISQNVFQRALLKSHRFVKLLGLGAIGGAFLLETDILTEGYRTPQDIGGHLKSVANVATAAAGFRIAFKLPIPNPIVKFFTGLVLGVGGVVAGNIIAEGVFELDKNFTKNTPDREKFFQIYFGADDKMSPVWNGLVGAGYIQLASDSLEKKKQQGSWWSPGGDIGGAGIYMYRGSTDLMTNPIEWGNARQRTKQDWNERVKWFSHEFMVELETLLSQKLPQKEFQTQLKTLLGIEDYEKLPYINIEVLDSITRFLSLNYKKIQAGKLEKKQVYTYLEHVISKMKIDSDYITRFQEGYDFEKDMVESALKGYTGSIDFGKLLWSTRGEYSHRYLSQGDDLEFVSGLPKRERGFIKELFQRFFSENPQKLLREGKIITQKQFEKEHLKEGDYTIGNYGEIYRLSEDEKMWNDLFNDEYIFFGGLSQKQRENLILYFSSYSEKKGIGKNQVTKYKSRLEKILQSATIKKSNITPPFLRVFIEKLTKGDLDTPSNYLSESELPRKHISLDFNALSLKLSQNPRILSKEEKEVIIEGFYIHYINQLPPRTLRKNQKELAQLLNKNTGLPSIKADYLGKYLTEITQKGLFKNYTFQSHIKGNIESRIQKIRDADIGEIQQTLYGSMHFFGFFQRITHLYRRKLFLENISSGNELGRWEK